jgi:hypothetical protein
MSGCELNEQESTMRFAGSIRDLLPPLPHAQSVLQIHPADRFLLPSDYLSGGSCFL